MRAIDVCATKAPAIAAEVARAHDVRIGRTSWKLRQTGNLPPPWTQPLVDQRVDDECVVMSEGGTIGVLTPIRVAAACLQCHGTAADLAPGVAEALERLYPDDDATGFAAGDLRGWFWVEVPPPGTED